jgi:hypothetical protein
MKHMNPKGQVAGQIFIYIMAIIVIGGIALIGYSAIKNITSKSCDAEKISFKAEIEGLIEKYTSYGSVNKAGMKAPCGYDTVCFVDSSSVGASKSISCSNSLLIENSVNEGVEQNIFAISSGKTIPIGYSALITLTNPLECSCIEKKNGKFDITFNGKGSSAEISNN